MSKIEIGRFSDLLRRFLELKGADRVSGELAPEIVPVFVLESVRPDWLFLKQERLCSVGGNLSTTGVTPGPTLRIRNPSGSGMIATVSKLYASMSSGIQLLEIAMTPGLNSDLAGGLIQAEVRDAREATSQRPSCVVSFNTTVAPAGNTHFIGYMGVVGDGNVAVPIEIDFVLPPGTTLDIGGSNSAVKVGIFSAYWTERPLKAIEAGETFRDEV